MNGIYSNPHLVNDFQRELAIASDKASGANPKASPAFTKLIEINANELLFKALNQCTHFKPTPGLEKKPSHWTSPPPGGPDLCIVIVMGLDSKGTLRARVSNAIPKPVKTEEACSLKFFDQFDAARSKPAQVKLLHQMVSSVASQGHMDWVERIHKEGQRYCTSPIFLVVIDGDKQYLYATTALIEGPPQTDRSVEWTGKVTP